MTTPLRIGIIGTGEMGRPLVDRLLGAGHEVAAYARRSDVRDELAAAGVPVVAQVAAGTLTLFVGGEVDAVERCRPLFAAYATEVVHFGPVGSGQKVKLINNLVFGAHVQLALEAGRLCDAFGLDEAEVARALHRASGASAAIDLVATMGSADELLALAGRFIRKDVVVARGLATDLGAPLGTLADVTEPLLASSDTD